VSENLYTNGEYLNRNHHWHQEDSALKAEYIHKMIRKHTLEPQTICEFGCGAGKILHQLSLHLPGKVVFNGYDISPQAIELCQACAGNRLRFYLADLLQTDLPLFDLVLAIDVIEHLEDYPAALRQLRHRARDYIFHFPLELTVPSVLRHGAFLGARERVGHLHFFTRELVLAVLRDAGYYVVDEIFTSGIFHKKAESWMQKVASLPRKIGYRLSPDFTARLLGGFSLLVYARNNDV
jgi:cyclopropane fatty-acyl-phospholipid synthase-like methyltransferase